jgi:hypothetical protein
MVGSTMGVICKKLSDSSYLRYFQDLEIDSVKSKPTHSRSPCGTGSIIRVLQLHSLSYLLSMPRWTDLWVCGRKLEEKRSGGKRDSDGIMLSHGGV